MTKEHSSKHPYMHPDDFRVRPQHPQASYEDHADRGKDFSDEREAIEAQTVADQAEIVELQDRLFASKQRALLLVFLAMDTGGKDSSIRRIFSGVNPQGCQVTSFGVPTAEERAHDFLWRVHPHTPALGMIGIFNRSHYEDVTVPVVTGAFTPAECAVRYGHIRDFEALLHEHDTQVVKFHLVISRKEQAERLQERLDDPQKHWKFDPADLENREHWGAYQQAFADVLHATSTDHAPWFVVPANRKWFRDAVIAHVVAHTLRHMDLAYPAPVADLHRYRID